MAVVSESASSGPVAPTSGLSGAAWMALSALAFSGMTLLAKTVSHRIPGEEIILAKAGKPYARLVPLERPKVERRPGRLKLANRIPDSFFFDPLPEEELRAWE